MRETTIFDRLFYDEDGIGTECNSNPKTITNKTVKGYVMVLSNKKSILLCDDFTYAIIPDEIINELAVCEGDKIYASVIYDVRKGHWLVIKIKTKSKRRKTFNQLTGIIPAKPLNSDRFVNFGECVAVHSKHQNNYEVIKTIFDNLPHKYAKYIALVIESKEEYTAELKSFIKEIYGTKTGTRPRTNIIAILWTLFRAKELCEKDKDVILIIYSFSKMLYYYNNVVIHSDSIQIINNIAIADFIREITCVKQVGGGGSLTIIGTVDDTVNNKFLCDRLQQADIKIYEAEDFGGGLHN
jgi:hypothetical protein